MKFDQMTGRRITELRQQRQLSQADLGERVGAVTGKRWHRQTVSVIERGERGVTGAELLALARVLQVTVSQLLLPSIGIDQVEMPGGATISRSEIELALFDTGQSGGNPAEQAIIEVGGWLSETLAGARIQLGKLRATYDGVKLGSLD